jgi:hypothetical protein
MRRISWLAERTLSFSRMTLLDWVSNFLYKISRHVYNINRLHEAQFFSRLEANSRSNGQEIPYLLPNSKVHNFVYKNSPLDPNLNKMNSIRFQTPYIKINFNIILPATLFEMNLGTQTICSSRVWEQVIMPVGSYFRFTNATGPTLPYTKINQLITNCNCPQFLSIVAKAPRTNCRLTIKLFKKNEVLSNFMFLSHRFNK